MSRTTEPQSLSQTEEDNLMLLESVKEFLVLMEYYYLPPEVRAYQSLIVTCLAKVEANIQKSDHLIRSSQLATHS
jgi:hypothetical protein